MKKTNDLAIEKEVELYKRKKEIDKEYSEENNSNQNENEVIEDINRE